MFKIAVDGGNYFIDKDPTSGIERILHELHKQSSENSSIRFTFYSFNRMSAHHLPRLGYSELFLPLKVLIDGCTHFFAVSTHIPLLLRFFPIKKIAIVHDLGFVKYPDFYENPQLMKKNLSNAVRNADIIICPSNYTKRELIKAYPSQDKSKIHVVPFGVNHLKIKMSKEKKNYFLAVGVVKPIKQVDQLIETYFDYCKTTKDSTNKLILIGMKEKKYYEKLLKRYSKSPYFVRIQFIESVPDEKMTEYYQNATALINVSKEEGFAFPVVEAASQSIPVVTNNIPLYDEYAPYFKSIYITQSKTELIKKLIEIGKQKNTHDNITPIFTWANFYKKLILLFKSS